MNNRMESSQSLRYWWVSEYLNRDSGLSFSSPRIRVPHGF